MKEHQMLCQRQSCRAPMARTILVLTFHQDQGRIGHIEGDQDSDRDGIVQIGKWNARSYYRHGNATP